ncbi:Hypothetical predicted protein [Olea europaea subsp. europaea]|uniref:Uncharacterized protein n=1 Tax=Olea europaea subsp. europaea TaxID=158383 RepID=A0A8S0TS08_OLEEU|nr:Hypothetical predicted protein [Olea europaea subsp. europaea]
MLRAEDSYVETEARVRELESQVVLKEAKQTKNGIDGDMESRQSDAKGEIMELIGNNAVEE